eukprot:3796327-Prymnesium_polylepis.1
MGELGIWYYAEEGPIVSVSCVDRLGRPPPPLVLGASKPGDEGSDFRSFHLGQIPPGNNASWRLRSGGFGGGDGEPRDWTVGLAASAPGDEQGHIEADAAELGLLEAELEQLNAELERAKLE